MTPQQRSTKVLRERGWHVEVVEQTIRAGKLIFKRDMLGAFDLQCWPVDDRQEGTMLVQVTSASNHAARRTKIANEPRVAYARRANQSLALHSWRKDSKGKWQLREEDVS